MRRSRVANPDADFDQRVIRAARRQGHRHDAAGSGAGRDVGRFGKLKASGRLGSNLDLKDDRPAGAENVENVDRGCVYRLACLARPAKAETGLLAHRPSSEAFRLAPTGPGDDVALRANEGQRTVEDREARRDLGCEDRLDLVGPHGAPAEIVDSEAFIRGEQAVQTKP